jgi:DNA transformation protein
VQTIEKLRDLPGLGPKTEAWLVEVGINTPDDLRSSGAIRAFIKLKNESRCRPGLNFLYALAGAIEGRHWLTVARSEKGRLLMELEGYHELEQLFKEEGKER